jgi:hypothetical protein
VAAGKGDRTVNALLVMLVIIGTAILGVALGVFSAYYALTGLLAACNPSRPSVRTGAVLVPQQITASGD